MPEIIDEAVSVDLLFNHAKRRAYPWVISWRGSTYRITKVGFHHIEWDGRVLIHIFSVTDGTTFFKLRFDTETLFWRLLEVDITEKN
jgi:hypothetical protein